MAAFTSIALAAGAAATVASGAMASSAAGKASKAQQQAAGASLDLQREQFDITRADSMPFLQSGQNANAAYAYEMGIGPRPTYDAEIGGRMDAANALTIGSNYTPGYSTGQFDPNFGRMSSDQLQARGINPQTGYINGSSVPGSTQYSAGGQAFGSRDEAQAFIDAQREQAMTDSRGNFDYQGYQASPGYDYRLAEGEQAIQRSAAARGNLNSGATLKALQKYGQDYASNDYGTFMNRLASQAGMGQTQANSMASLGQNFANAGSNTLMQAGNAKASGYVNQGNIMGSAMGQLGQIGGNFIGGLGGGMSNQQRYGVGSGANSMQSMGPDFVY
jgi:hypothetical protein